MTVRCVGRRWGFALCVLAAGLHCASARELEMNGWIDVSVSKSSAGASARPLAFNDQVDDAMLQQLWLKLDYAVPSEGRGWGFRSDSIVQGADYRFTRARGLFERQDGHSGFDPVQFYAEGHWPDVGLKLKLGRFFSPYGVESIEAPSNMLFSHSHTFTYNPFTHLGALAIKTEGEWTYTLGALAGSDVFVDDSNRLTAFGGVRWTEASSGPADSVAIGSILGNAEFDAANVFNHPNIVDVVWTHPIDSRLTAILEGLAGWQSGVPGVGGVRWQGVVGYLTYAWNEELTPAVRLELFDDEDGNRTGFAGTYTAATLGLTWRPRDRLLVRPEIRNDRNDTSAPWDGKDRLTTLAVDVIYRW